MPEIDVPHVLEVLVMPLRKCGGPFSNIFGYSSLRALPIKPPSHQTKIQHVQINIKIPFSQLSICGPLQMCRAPQGTIWPPLRMAGSI